MHTRQGMQSPRKCLLLVPPTPPTRGAYQSKPTTAARDRAAVAASNSALVPTHEMVTPGGMVHTGDGNGGSIPPLTHGYNRYTVLDFGTAS